jgi:hypothetical protein
LGAQRRGGRARAERADPAHAGRWPFFEAFIAEDGVDYEDGSPSRGSSRARTRDSIMLFDDGSVMREAGRGSAAIRAPRRRPDNEELPDDPAIWCREIEI